MASNTTLNAAPVGMGHNECQLAKMISKNEIDVLRTGRSCLDRELDLHIAGESAGNSDRSRWRSQLLKIGALLQMTIGMFICAGCIEGSVTLRGTVDMGDCQADVDLVLKPSAADR